MRLKTNALKKDAGLMGLLFAGVGSMIGSGWLFGPLATATQAGPLSVFSWLLGGVVALLIAFVFAELATLFPLSGALVHMSHVSHGPLVGLIWSWVLFFAYVAIAPIEAMAIVTYANAYMPGLLEPTLGVLTTKGFIVATGLLACMVLLNFLMIKTVLTLNTWVTWWKILIPLATVVVLLSYSWHPENLSVAPPKDGLEAVFTAIATGGVLFSLFGFRQAIELAGETKNPSRNLPIAILTTVVIGTAIYVFLQLGFLLAIEPEMLVKGGWGGLALQGLTGPFATLAAIVGAGWWAKILYVDALISPAACGFVHMTTTSRVGMAGAQMKAFPSVMATVNSNGVPWVALLCTFAVGVVFFFPFPSWKTMAGYISSVTVLSYGIGPILLLRLRKALPNTHRPFKLRAAWLIAPLAFICSNWIILWVGAQTVNFILMLIVLFVAVHALHFFFVRKGTLSDYNLRSSWWLIPYFGGIWLISRFAPTELGGSNDLSFGGSMAVMAVFSLVILALALRVSQTDEQIKLSFAQALNAETPQATPPQL